MAEVITRLKVDNQGYDQKIRNAQRSLDQFGLKGTEVGQKMSGLGRVLTTNIGALSKWSVGLGAASAALKVAGDAFKHSETSMDSWNATMDSAKSAYNSFLTALNTSDFSSFFTNIRQVIAAARDAYNSLDELGTYNAFAARGNAKNRAAYSEAVANYKENKSAENRAAVEAASAAILADLKEQKKLTADAYAAAVKKLALEQGMTGANVDEFVNMFSNKSWAELQSAKAGYAKGKGANIATYWNGYQVQGNDLLTRNASGVVTGRRAMTEAEKAAFRFAKALNEVTDEEIKNVQSLGAQEYQLEQAIADQRRNAARMLGEEKKTNTPTVTTPKEEKAAPAEGSIDYQTQLVAKLRKEWTAAASDEARATIKTQLDEATAALDALLGKTKEVEVALEPAFQTGSLDDLQNKLREATADMQSLTVGTDEWAAALERVRAAQAAVDAAQAQLSTKGEEQVEIAKDTTSAWSYASQAVGSVGSALQGLDDPGAKVAGIIAGAIAQVAAGLGSMLAQPQSTSQSWGWIALAASGAATMVGTIAAIKQATEYHANGDIIGTGIFTPKGTDTVPCMLTPGEEVLTANDPRHRNNIGAIGGGIGALTLRTEVSGESLAIVLDNNNRRRGRAHRVR